MLALALRSTGICGERREVSTQDVDDLFASPGDAVDWTAHSHGQRRSLLVSRHQHGNRAGRGDHAPLAFGITLNADVVDFGEQRTFVDTKPAVVGVRIVAPDDRANLVLGPLRQQYQSKGRTG